jgi:hypothetical protein
MEGCYVVETVLDSLVSFNGIPWAGEFIDMSAVIDVSFLDQLRSQRVDLGDLVD